MPAFVDQLAECLDWCDAYAAAIAEGPLADLGPVSTRIFWRQQSTLHLLGMRGYVSSPEAGYQSIALDTDIPLCQAVREGEVVVTVNVGVSEAYAGDAGIRDRWIMLHDRFPAGSMICAPIDSRGVMIGGLALITDRYEPPSAWQFARTQCVCSGLALWMAHPDTGIPWSESSRVAVELSERQRQILRLAAAGNSTTAIARTMDYSSSTIKQEMQRIMRSLGVGTRDDAVAEARRQGLLEASS